MGIEGLNLIRGTVHDGSAGIDDGLETRVDHIGANERRGSADLPKARLRRDLVILDGTNIFCMVSAAEEEFGPEFRQVEPKLARGHCALVLSRVEEGLLT